MKILVVSTVPFANDGITNVIINNYQHIDYAQIKMNFVFPNKPNDSFYNDAMNRKSKVFVIPNRTNEILKYMKELNRLLKKENYDVVHVHGNSSTMILELFLAKINGVFKRVAHTHAKYTKYPILNKMLNPIFKSTFTTALAPSVEAGDFLFGRGKYQVLENGIAVEDYEFTNEKRKNIRAEFCLNDNEFVIGNIGRLAEEKNQKYLIELLKKMNNIRYKLLIIGSGPLELPLKKIVKEYGLEKQVVFTGVRYDIGDLLSALDALIIPSLSEGFGITAIEGQAAELPVFISENIPKDVIQTPLVSVFMLNEMNELINKINNLSPDITSREKNKNNSNIKKSPYNAVNSAEKLKRIYLNERN